MPRNYKREYRLFHSSRAAKDGRNLANKARRMLGLKKGDPEEADHVVPKSKGGGNSKKNLRAVSRETNRRKGSDMPENKKTGKRRKLPMTTAERAWVGRKMKKLMKEGKSKDQALAIALRRLREKKEKK